MPTFDQLMALLPEGQSFAAIRRSGRIYVDKTRYVYDLATSNQPWLLTRPRGFGKSTLLSAFEELFMHGVAPYDGHDSYFKGLEIEQLWPHDQWYDGPFYVLHLNFSELLVGCHSVADFAEQLNAAIWDFAAKEHLVLNDPYYGKEDAWEMLLDAVPDLSLVLLVAGYDAPLNHFEDTDQESARDDMVRVLRAFFCFIKSRSHKFRFTLITGCTRLQAANKIWSEVNSIVDISQMPRYGAICGFTLEELQRYFPEHLRYASAQWLQLPQEQVTAQHVEQLVSEMDAWYGGYCFDRKGRTQFLSPFSVLSFFSEEHTYFETFWVNDGGYPELLRNAVRQLSWPWRLRLLAGDSMSVDLYGCSEQKQADLLLLQTGYLTRQAAVGDDGATSSFFFVAACLPNKELKSAFFRWWYADLLPKSKVILQENMGECFGAKQRAAIASKDAAALQQCCNEFLRDSDGERYPLLQASDVADFLHSCLALVLALPVTDDDDEHELWGRDKLLLTYQGTTVLIAFAYAQERSESSALLPQAVKLAQDSLLFDAADQGALVWRLAMVFCAESREITDVQVISG